MIAQYKREQEEQNKYVDPTTRAEFQYVPTGMTPALSTSTLVPVPSLGAPATQEDAFKEKNNYAKNYQDIQDKKQEIEDKKREGKEKEKEKAEKKAEVKELKSQWAKIDKLKKKDEQREKDATKRLGTLTKITKPKPEDLEEINELNKEIPELQTRIAEFIKNQTDLEAVYLPMETTEIPALETDILTLIAEIKQIQTVDIPALEIALEQSGKDIITYQENIDDNEIIQNKTNKENKKLLKEYQDTFNIMNKTDIK
jgi:chromosome segregation ATPase